MEQNYNRGNKSACTKDAAISLAQQGLTPHTGIVCRGTVQGQQGVQELILPQFAPKFSRIESTTQPRVFYTNSFSQFSNMSPPTTPNRAIKYRQADTVKKTRFYQAYDSKTRDVKSLAAEHNITKQTAYNWLRQHRIQGSPAYQRSRKLSECLGRQPILTNDQIQRLLSPSNPVQNQHYEHQIQHFNLSCCIHTLQETLHRSTKNARCYKSMQVKQLSKKNKG